MIRDTGLGACLSACRGRETQGPAVLLLLVACAGPPRPPAVPAVPVTVARAERRPVPFAIEATGTVEPVQTVAIESQVGGVLQEVAFREGDDVEAGQLLFRIDPRPYQAALAQAEAILARDQAQSEFAEADVKRYEELVRKDFVTAQQYDQVRAAAGALQATLAADRAAVENARLNLQYATIRAPIAGRTGSVLVRAGNLVRANSGTPLVVINRIHPILVRFAVPALQLALVREYQRRTTAVVLARPAGVSGAGIVGTLAFIDNAVDSATGTILLKGRFANTDKMLWPGEFVAVSLQLYVEPDALVIPVAAVVSGQQGDYVFVVGPEGTATTRSVKVARAAGDLAVIASGLQPGEQVVTDGQLRLTAGAKVDIRSSSSSPEGSGAP